MPEIDVIAQWNHDGEIIPKRVQVHTEDGAQPYTIQSCVPVSHSGETVHGKFITAQTLVWECSIIVRNERKVIYLFFDGRGWSMTT